MDNTKLNIGEVRFSYLHVFQPQASAGGSDKKYSVALIIPKSNTELVAKIKEAIRNAYNAGIGTFGGSLPEKGRWRSPLRDGDVEKAGDEAYKDSWFINASSKTRPGIVKRDPTGVQKFVPIADEQELYSGCYGYASVNFFAYNNSGNKGISAGLNNVLKTRNGDFLGGRASAESDFDSLDLENTPESDPVSDDNIF